MPRFWPPSYLFLACCNAEAISRRSDEILTQHARRQIVTSDDMERAMTPQEIDLVQQSLPAVLALRDSAPARLDEHLVEFYPAPRPLFAGADARRQVPLLITVVAKAMEAPRPGDHECVATVLCQYHSSSEIEAHHFRSAGAALVDVLAQQLGSRFTAELRDAWTSAFEWVGRMVLEPRNSFAA
jgi:hemoglobin-like flavoprotein